MQNPLFATVISAAILLAAPALSTRFARSSLLPSILLFSLFVIIQQLLFAVSASLFGSYFVSFPFAAALLSVGAFLWGKAHPPVSTARELSRIESLLPWLISGVIFVGYAAIRANYSYINFNNNGDEAGVEKLFNLSLQQSFLFGEGYPPIWVWLAGEPIRYYVFLKSIPGLGSWIARVALGNSTTGGVYFILSEAAFGSLPYGVICGWVLWFGREAKSRAAVLTVAALVSLFCFLGTHYQAVSLGLKALLSRSTLDWWQLSHQVIPYTDNQYPVWLMILGDNHAYMQVYFLQILFWGAFLRLATLEKLSPLSSAAVGALAGALVLSHPGSVLVDLSVLGTFLLLLFVHLFHRRRWEVMKRVASHGALAAVVAVIILAFLYSPVGAVKVVVPPRELVSKLLAFLNLNFSVLVWLGLLMAVPLWRERARSAKRNLSAIPILLGSIAVTVAFYLLSLPALSVMILLGYFTYLMVYREEGCETERILTIFAVTSFVIWLPPEVVAFDHTLDSRTDWIRFQMGLRFWPEGYLLIPFALTVALIGRIGERPIGKLWPTLGFVTLLLLFLSHIPGVSNRISRSQQKNAELDGFAEFDRRHPVDAAIVAYLRSIPEGKRLEIAESCGIGDPRVPHHFAWPGRIAAFSGRAGVCGWARHAVLYNNPLSQLGFKGVSVEERTATFLNAYAGFFWRLSGGDRERANLELMTLRALGVTHIVYGEFERGLYPQFSISRAAEILPLTVVFDASNGLGVLKINE